ncbi:hypothetical protein [Actinomadura sp. 9N407]|uniref:hypothetical protein n=1 Tax=Actinomadura sp. 9N407 TaxID=3375154 RepID=UPI0037A4B1EF
MTAVAPWVAVELEPERVAAELARRFPGVCAWRGEYTGSWWALSRDRYGRDGLIEADSPAELGRLLERIHWMRVVPREARTAPRTGPAAQAIPLLPRAPRVPAATRPAPRRQNEQPRRRLPRRRRSLLRWLLAL